jgi:hypothetical protein
MGKKIVIMAGMVLLLFCSCQTKPQVWDNSYPEEKLAEIRFMGINIDSYNGISVTKFNWVMIPAGDTTFGGTVTINHSGVQFTARDMEFTSRFEEGRSYIVVGNQNEMRWGVSIYEGEKYSQLKDENLVAFVPFKEQPKFVR